MRTHPQVREDHPAIRHAAYQSGDDRWIWLTDYAKRLEDAIDSIYATCEGAGGHFQDALEAIMDMAADHIWTPRDDQERDA